MAVKKMSFEEAMSALEEIILKLEEGSVSLEESVKLYKKGAELAELCRKKLTDAEGEILILKEKYDASEKEESELYEKFDEDAE